MGDKLCQLWEGVCQSRSGGDGAWAFGRAALRLGRGRVGRSESCGFGHEGAGRVTELHGGLRFGLCRRGCAGAAAVNPLGRMGCGVEGGRAGRAISTASRIIGIGGRRQPLPPPFSLPYHGTGVGQTTTLRRHERLCPADRADSTKSVR
jgi:hypothetical protein